VPFTPPRFCMWRARAAQLKPATGSYDKMPAIALVCHYIEDVDERRKFVDVGDHCPVPASVTRTGAGGISPCSTYHPCRPSMMASGSGRVFSPCPARITVTQLLDGCKVGRLGSREMRHPTTLDAP